MSAEAANRRPQPTGTGWAPAPRQVHGAPNGGRTKPAARSADAGGAADPAGQLTELTEELGRLADEIAQAARRPRAVRAVDAAFVRRLIHARQRRVAAFGADLFADPVWDMMLDLLAARLEGRAVRTSSLCIAAGVPGTTAMRWIRLLTERGLFIRVADPHDRRSVLIALSDDTAERLTAHLAASTESVGL